ncbi:secernin-1-like isoform X1 [Chiloscyllium plagiosum]|uniref:secernin-1-like isoform X1 n=2 Tax=Chiloscyllium plagiosum TaxID=36176 RepID=UPI001CB86CD8|nr:secernin-1-like isoform X1 [Chiloscyllium plagiosum]
MGMEMGDCRHARVRMAVPPSSSCFAVLPPATEDANTIFGKNSARPCNEVQEVIYLPSVSHESGSKLQCTYIAIDQVERTLAVILSKPAWMWGAEMGANDHGVCIGNGAVVTRETATETEGLLGMDLVRLGLERGTTAKEAFDIIVSLLKEHGQGGNNFEDGAMLHAFHGTFLIVDRTEAWVLETAGKYWAAEKITEGLRSICNRLSITTNIDAEHPELRSYAQSQGWWNGEEEFNFSTVFSVPGGDEDLDHLCAGKELLQKHAGNITMQTMMNVLRDKNSMDLNSYLVTGSMVSILPQSSSLPCIHSFTATPNPARSIFKPFIFVDNVKPVPKTQSPSFGNEDPVNQQPRFQSTVDRRHELYQAHECARAVMETEEDAGQKLWKTMLDLEKQGLEAMQDILKCEGPVDPSEFADLFYDCVDTEIKFYK